MIGVPQPGPWANSATPNSHHSRANTSGFFWSNACAVVAKGNIVSQDVAFNLTSTGDYGSEKKMFEHFGSWSSGIPKIKINHHMISTSRRKQSVTFQVWRTLLPKAKAWQLKREKSTNQSAISVAGASVLDILRRWSLSFSWLIEANSNQEPVLWMCCFLLRFDGD